MNVFLNRKLKYNIYRIDSTSLLDISRTILATLSMIKVSDDPSTDHGECDQGDANNGDRTGNKLK